MAGLTQFAEDTSAIRKATEKLAASSRRLEFATYGLIVLTIILAVLTVSLLMRTHG